MSDSILLVLLHLRRLIARIVDRITKLFIPIKNTRLKELLQPRREILRSTRQLDQMVDVVVRIERVRPRYVLVQGIWKMVSEPRGASCGPSRKLQPQILA